MQRRNFANIFFRRSIAFCIAAVVCCVSAAPVFADEGYIPAEKISISTPVYEANMADFNPPLGQYEYSVKWQGIGAAKLLVNVEKVGMQYRISAEAKTNGIVDVFYELRYTAKGILSAVDLLPVQSSMESKENSREKKAEVHFLPDGLIKSTYWRKGQKPQVKQFDSDNFTLDPFSAAFLARSLDWEVGQTRKFDTYNGKSRYLIEFTAVEKTTMKVNGKERPVWVVAPRVQKLTARKPKKKLKSAKIYVTADEKREILKIVSSVFIGSVTTRLESFTPAPASASQTHVASVSAPKRQKMRVR